MSRLPPREDRDRRQSAATSGNIWQPRKIEWANELADRVVSALAAAGLWFVSPRSVFGVLGRGLLLLWSFVWLATLLPKPNGPAAVELAFPERVAPPAVTVSPTASVAAPAAVERPARGSQAAATDRDPFGTAPRLKHSDQRPVPGGWVYDPEGSRGELTVEQSIRRAMAHRLPIRPGQSLWVVLPAPVILDRGLVQQWERGDVAARAAILRGIADGGKLRPKLVTLDIGTEVDWQKAGEQGSLFEVLSGRHAGARGVAPLDVFPAYIDNRRPPDHSIKPGADQPLGKRPGDKPTDPERARSLVHLAKQLLDSGKPEGARKRLAEVLERYPDSEAAGDARTLLDSLPAAR